MSEYARFDGADGTAALGICELLLLALIDLKIISEKDVVNLLTDVATTHDEAAAVSPAAEKHRAVAAVVQRILIGKDASAG